VYAVLEVRFNTDCIQLEFSKKIYFSRKRVYFITPTGNARKNFRFSSLPSSGLVPDRVPYFVKIIVRILKVQFFVYLRNISNVEFRIILCKKDRDLQFSCFVDRHPCIILQIEPTWFTVFLKKINCISVHVSGNYVPIIRRKYRTNTTPGICHSV
jgi:hypothetical protein